jgi:hypothetical protein
VLCWQPISGLKDVAKQIAASNFSWIRMLLEIQPIR